MPKNQTLKQIRIDKWLWAARFYKTRQLAAKAIKTGKIAFNGQNAKPSSCLKITDLVCIKRGPYKREVEVMDLSDKRGSASVAQTLYQETQSSIQQALLLKQQLAAAPMIRHDAKKPDKRAVRNVRELKRGN